MASTCPCSNAGTIDAGGMLISVMSDSFRLLALRKSGSIVVCDEPDGTPTFLPARSLIDLMPVFFSAETSLGFD